MRTFSFLFTVLLSSVSFAEVGFQNGNKITVQPIHGRATFNCKDNLGNMYTKYWTCRKGLVSPGSHDYLASTSPINADKVILTAESQNGFTQTKNVSFNSKKSVSKNRVNLVVRTLTQVPLLREGHNTVNYEFTKGNKSVTTGNFHAHVTVNEVKECRPRTFFGNQNECQFENNACETYFYYENNCQY